MNNVSISGYHKWYQAKDNIHKDHADFQLIKTEFEKLKKKGGYRRICMNLSKKINHKKVSRIMRENGLYSTVRRANPYRIMARRQKAHLSIPNTLNREFKVTSPYTKSATDISYFHYKNGIAYLSAVKDICTREILAWRVYTSLEHVLVLDTIADLKKYCISRGILMDKLLMHSDQGWHYDHTTFRSVILACGITQSMSRKGNCIDNSPMETFFGHTKDEIDVSACTTVTEVRQIIDEYIHVYNNQRKQWTLNKMTPVEYRDHLLTINPK